MKTYLTVIVAALLICVGCGEQPSGGVGPSPSISPIAFGDRAAVVTIPEGQNSCPDGAYPKNLHANPADTQHVIFFWLPEDSIDVYDFEVERRSNYNASDSFVPYAEYEDTPVGTQGAFFYADWRSKTDDAARYRVRIRTKSRCDTYGPWSPWATFETSQGPDRGRRPPSPGSGSSFVLGSNILPFASLAGAAITCTTSTITGDVGVSPGSSITGIPGLCVLNGSIISTAGSVAAQADLAAHYAAFDALPCTPIAANLNGVTLTPGVYCSGALASNLTGTLTLDGAGFYLIRFPSTLITSAGSNVSLIGGATCGGVHFQAASSATLEGSLTGNVIAFSSVTLNPGAVLTGRALARNAAVTLTTATMDITGCS